MNYTLSDVRQIFKSANGINISRVGEVELRSLLMNDNRMMYANAGFYGDEDDLKKWKREYINAIIGSDILLDVYTCDSFKITSSLLLQLGIYKNTVPYYEEDLKFWLNILKDLGDQEVCIVSYFADDMKKQEEHLSKIHNTNLHNKFSYIKTWNTTEEEDKPHENYFDTLDILKRKIDKCKAKYFLLSCGCYGLPLCNYIKKKKKNAMYVGGQLQLLFGLKGSRWDKRKNISSLYNEYWKYSEIKPKGYKKIENSCYWEEEVEDSSDRDDSKIT